MIVWFYRIRDGNILSDTIDTCIQESTPERIRKRYRSLKDAAAQHDYGELDESVVIIDTETTGVSFHHDELTQIAAARMEHGSIVEWFVTFVNPGKPIPEDITHLTNISNDDVVDAPSPDEAINKLCEFVGTSDLVAHNAAFDKHFVTRHEAGEPLRSNVWIDSLDLTRIALPHLKSHRLIDLVHAFDAPVSTHRADADVEALATVYRILLAAVDAMPDDLVTHIASMADVSDWPTVKVFKHFATDDARPFSLRVLRRSVASAAFGGNHVDANDIVTQLKFPADDEISDAFSSEGIMGKIYPNYEERSAQKVMARSVIHVFKQSKNLAVEAGTGVGKSMAYLIPAVMTAHRNHISIGVATKTNALLDQLVNTELPALSREIEGITYTSLKGITHYPCLRRIEQFVEDGPKERTVNGQIVQQAPALAALLSFIEQSDYDDIDSLKMDYRAIPRYFITTKSTDCMRNKCPFFGEKCFVHGVRQRAEHADIVVTNQSMLFCNVAAEGGLLPPIRYWVVDEAHGAEDEARRAFSYTLDADDMQRLATKVASSDGHRNIFMRAERQATGRKDMDKKTARESIGEQAYESADGSGMSDGDVVLFTLTGKARRAGEAYQTALDAFTPHIHELLKLDTSRRSKGYDNIDLWLSTPMRSEQIFLDLVSTAHDLADTIEELIKHGQNIVEFLEGIEGAARTQREIASVTMNLRDMLASIEVILFEAPTTFAYAAHLTRRNRGSEYLQAIMINVGDEMNKTLYAQTQSIVFTSATMTIADSFDTFTQSMGLGQSEYSESVCTQLESCYDYDGHMTIYVASDMPDPQSANYLQSLERLLIGIHRAQEGSTLTLFTNRREMEKSFSVVQPALRENDLRVVCQKWGVSIKGLRDDFLSDEHLSLFALKSFWEGFDAPGATLKTVVIPKLPFGKPTDPLSCERMQNDARAWMHYVLPAAVLETKQAAGRVIRGADDTGSLVLADHRLVTKGYGRIFLRSMPSHTIKVLPTAEIVAALSEQIGK